MLTKTRIKQTGIEFKVMIRRRNQLKKRLLMFGNDEYESLKPENQDKIRAFKLLMHAELEHYIESITKSVLVESKTQWESTRMLNSVLLMMLVYNQSGYAGNNNECIPGDRVNRIIKDAINNIDSNHGIKEKNLYLLLQQIGINLQLNYSLLVADLESYGKSRGAIAHTSFASIQTQMIKRVELNKINQIIDGLIDLDVEVSNKKMLVTYSMTV